MKYEIKSKADDVKDTVLEKTGHKIHFSVREVEQAQAYNESKLKEVKAKRDLEAAKIKNIEEHHPFVKDLSDEDRSTVHLYHESKYAQLEADNKVKEFEVAINELKSEIAEVQKQLPEIADAWGEPKKDKKTKKDGDKKAKDNKKA